MTRFHEVRERCDGRVTYSMYTLGRTYPCARTVIAQNAEDLDAILKACGWVRTTDTSLCGNCVQNGRTSKLSPTDEDA